MNYVSTRDKNKKVSSAFAIKEGISSDGGLYTPENIPSLSFDEILGLVDKSYLDRANYILKKYLTDFTDGEVEYCVGNAYTTGNFEVESIAPLHRLDENKFILELWHGPTCAFKDMALQILPHLLTKSMQKTGEKREAVILVATSGDTGKAALEGFKDVEGTKIFVFYPQEGVSRIQKLQMTTQEGENVYVCGINGNFDDAQNGVKAIFTNEDIKKKFNDNGCILSSANSINWGRLAPQIVYYISAYCDLLKSNEIKNGEKINICVPTGNFGNILAAYCAKEMGLPVNKLICASNKNNVLTEFIETGIYDKNRPFYSTMSPSMDILISSNLERLLFYILEKDDKKIFELMTSLKDKGTYTIREQAYETLKSGFSAGFCDDEKTSETIKTVFDKYNYLCDTHTAVAIKVYEDYKKKTGDTAKTIIASTASPYKFSDNVLSALDKKIISKNLSDFEMIEELFEISKQSPPKELESLKDKNIRFNTNCEKTEMTDTMFKMLGI